MSAELIDETENLRRTAERLQRAGLIVDCQSFSRIHRRAFFALQCQLAREPQILETNRPLIGFEYPNARKVETLQ